MREGTVKDHQHFPLDIVKGALIRMIAYSLVLLALGFAMGRTSLHCPQPKTIVLHQTKVIYRRSDLSDFPVNPNFTAMMKLDGQADARCGISIPVLAKAR